MAPPAAKKPAAPKPAAPATAYYANCAAARAAGAAPLYRGEPGYRSGLDRDNDGVACE
ncbi:excalibur calcium-binding domain-containing protein [Knoellia locipacati]|uniref:excalibur calcium-binding domain-containing protein n=1 Tax=Knoellia locipacati TaxID=882824 RepID=UPI001FE9DF23|nr:excalibur calcium-binding domain-containing protein [Knoellia locipacati]